MENVPDYPGFSLYSFQQREEGAAGAEVIVGLKQQLNTVGSRNLYGFTITPLYHGSEPRCMSDHPGLARRIHADRDSQALLQWH